MCFYGEKKKIILLIAKAILMSTHNVFLWRNNENYPLSQNTRLIWSTGNSVC